MKSYIYQQYLVTRSKYEKYSTRLIKSQERGEFQKLSRGKQNFLITRIKKLWEKLRILEAQLKITTVGASLAFILMVSNLNAQEQFVAAPEKNPLPPPTVFGFSPFLVDIDSDGDLDLLAMEDYIGNDLFLNTGTPTAPKFEKVPDEDSPFNGISEEAGFDIWDIVDAADLDGDGDIDILSDDGYILWNTGSNSDIQFTAEELSGYFYEGSFGDIDGDGDLDLIRLDYSNNVRVNLNVGNTTNFNIDFDTPVIFSVTNWDEGINYASFLKALDFDEDDDFDLIIRSSTDEFRSIKIIENTGTTEFAAFSLLDDANNPYRDLETSYMMQFGDLDGDGDFDVLEFNYYQGGGLQFYENTGNTVAENKEFIPEFYDGIVLPYSYFPPQFIDYDDDGDMDLFAWSYYTDNGNSIYYEYQETGKQLKYIERPDISLPFIKADLYYQIPIFVDLDIDGDLDVLMIYEDYISESWEWAYVFFENIGSIAAPVYQEHDFPPLNLLEELFIPSFIDIDDDGDLDMFLGGEQRIEYGYYSYWRYVTLYYESTGVDPLEFTRRTGEGNPLDFVTEDNYEDIMEYGNIVFSDVDEDGDFDVVFSGYYGLYFLENTGNRSTPVYEDKSENGPFSSVPVGYYSILNLVDIDGDGDDDLFVHEVYGMITKFYENTGGSGPGSLFEPSLVHSLQIYPNPAGDVIHVLLDMEGIDKASYEILSVEGKIMKKGTIEGVNTAGDVSIGTAELQEGFYFLRVQGGDQIKLTEFVKQ